MSVLAHCFEAAGIATVVLASVRAVAEKVAPPRALYCEFPLGRPLGRPQDADFQHDVLRAAFALLDAPSGPVLVDYPEKIESDESPVACALPARFDPDALPAADEARGVRKAFDRTRQRRGVTSVGRVIGPDEIPDALERLHSIATGTDWTAAGLPGGNSVALSHDIRAYYEEAAIELTDGPPPGGRAFEAWYFEATEAGALDAPSPGGDEGSWCTLPTLVLHGAGASLTRRGGASARWIRGRCALRPSPGTI